MSLSASCDLEFADGSYTFTLLLPQQVELEDKCGAIDGNGIRRRKGMVAIYRDLIAGLGINDAGDIVANPFLGIASAYEAREVIRLALIGGGKGIVDGVEKRIDAVEAKRLLQIYVDPAPVVERWTIAAAIMKTAVEGYEPPKKKAVTTAKPLSRTRKTRST